MEGAGLVITRLTSALTSEWMDPGPLDPGVSHTCGLPLTMEGELSRIQRVTRIASLVKYSKAQLDKLVC